MDVSLNPKLTNLNLIGFGGGSKTICVNETQMAAIPGGWAINGGDSYSTTNCIVGIDELGADKTKELIQIYNLMGQEVDINDATEGVFIYQYSDGTSEKRATIAQ